MHATDRARDWRTGRARRHAQMEEMERKAARKQEAQEQEAQEQEAQEQEARGPSPVMRPGLAAG